MQAACCQPWAEGGTELAQQVFWFSSSNVVNTRHGWAGSAATQPHLQAQPLITCVLQEFTLTAQQPHVAALQRHAAQLTVTAVAENQRPLAALNADLPPAGRNSLA
jgi:hypothetical protein